MIFEIYIISEGISLHTEVYTIFMKSCHIKVKGNRLTTVSKNEDVSNICNVINTKIINRKLF